VLDPSAFHSWLITLEVPLAGVEGVTVKEIQPIKLSQVLLALTIYAVVLLGVLGTLTPPAEVAGWRRRWAGQACAGMVAALAGYCSLMDHSRAVVPRLPVGDMTVMAAVALTGGIVLAGNFRSHLTGLLVPPATLAATLWVQRFSGYGRWGIEWQVVFLLVVIATYQGWLRFMFRKKSTQSPQPEAPVAQEPQ
jgi:hypothetical protein